MKEHENEAEDGSQGGHGTSLHALDTCVCRLDLVLLLSANIKKTAGSRLSLEKGAAGTQL